MKREKLREEIYKSGRLEEYATVRRVEDREEKNGEWSLVLLVHAGSRVV